MGVTLEREVHVEPFDILIDAIVSQHLHVPKKDSQIICHVIVYAQQGVSFQVKEHMTGPFCAIVDTKTVMADL